MSAYPSGYNFKGQRAVNAERGLARLAAENAQRVQCPHCDLRVMPDALERHVKICHEE